MDCDDYQVRSRKYAKYPNMGNQEFCYPILGLCGETGEVSEKLKKVIRDKGGHIDDDTRESIKLEVSDVLWYVAQLCTELGFTMSEVLQANLDKLEDRWLRNKIHGEGDNR